MRAGPVASASLLHVAGLVSVLLLMRSPPLRAPAAEPVIEVVAIDPAQPELAPPEPAASQPAPAPAATPPLDLPPHIEASAPEPAPPPAQDAEAAPVPSHASVAEPIPSAAEPSLSPDAVQPAPPADTLPAAPEAEFPRLAPSVPVPLPRAMTRVSPPLHAKLDRHEHVQAQVTTVPPAPSAAAPAPAGASIPAHAARDDAALEARIRDAVQAAVHYPAAARMMGLVGRTRLELDYRSGGVAHPSLAQSAGASLLDEAALAAARAARYPAPPPDVGGRLLRLLVWVEFKPG